MSIHIYLYIRIAARSRCPAGMNAVTASCPPKSVESLRSCYTGVYPQKNSGYEPAATPSNALHLKTLSNALHLKTAKVRAGFRT